MWLLPGDEIPTGTPFGVAYNKSGLDYLQTEDLLRFKIESLGE
ncbi:hypothetical protein [Rhizobium sp. SL42]|nr:hypothetical protein IM739_23295 [Rhizobium sp. SL42]